MTGPTDYQQATVRVQARKTALLSSLYEARERLAPGRLLVDAKGKIIGSISAIPSQAVIKVRERPVAFGAAASAFTIYLFRRPLAALLGRVYVRLKDRNRETDHG